MSGQPGQPQPAPILPAQGVVQIGQTTIALTTGPIPPPEQLTAYEGERHVDPWPYWHRTLAERSLITAIDRPAAGAPESN